MENQIEIGAAVEYDDPKGKVRQGTVHGVKTHETVKGKVTQSSYLIATGKELDTGIVVGVDKKGKEITRKNPEQVEVSAENVRALKK